MDNAKEILLKVTDAQLAEKLVGEITTKRFQGGEYTFYIDGTYTFSPWNNDEISKWKIEGGQFLVFHSGDSDWTTCNDDDDAILIDMLEAEIALRNILT